MVPAGGCGINARKMAEVTGLRKGVYFASLMHDCEVIFVCVCVLGRFLLCSRLNIFRRNASKYVHKNVRMSSGFYLVNLTVWTCIGK